MWGSQVGGQLLNFFSQRVLDGELMRDDNTLGLNSSAPALVWLQVFRIPLLAAAGVPSPYSVRQAPRFRSHLYFTVYFLFSFFGMVFRIWRGRIVFTLPSSNYKSTSFVESCFWLCVETDEAVCGGNPQKPQDLFRYLPLPPNSATSTIPARIKSTPFHSLIPQVCIWLS